jgi:hypothetical protein
MLVLLRITTFALIIPCFQKKPVTALKSKSASGSRGKKGGSSTKKTAKSAARVANIKARKGKRRDDSKKLKKNGKGKGKQD